MNTLRPGIIIKTREEIKLMKEGGEKLAKIKDRIERLAQELIKEEGGKASFKMVPGYRWATCVNVNEGVVHGIPSKNVIFKKGDVVSVDVGMFYKNFHTDTSFTIGVEVSSEIKTFLQTGTLALENAISKARPGAKVYDISYAIESVLKKRDFNPIRALVGHGVGRNLHEEPAIPCFVGEAKREDSVSIPVGAVLAIEVMYTQGREDVQIKSDGWTIVTADAKISALFEDTVAVTDSGHIVLTEANRKS